MPFFSKVFKGGSSEKHSTVRQPKENGAFKPQPPKPRWDDAWTRPSVEPEEVQELLRGCSQEIKARALDVPFLILPFRPASDPSAAKSFVRNFFGDGRHPENRPSGELLVQELRLLEPLVLCSVCKWAWGRLAGGIVTWEAYELFTIGEKDSNEARDAFNTFIPISVASQARERIIFDFFDLLAAVAAHGKTNGLGGRKLSRLAGWWAFEHTDMSNGFESGYKSWIKAANATSHLFFAYLRSLAPNSSKERSGVTLLPRALEALLDATEYPPVTKAHLQMPSSKVAMIVETVSPTPFALLRRAKDFRYRDEDHVLQRFSDFEDPADALTDECRRVLRAISSANDTSSAKTSTSLKDPSWSRFEDIGFGSLAEESSDNEQSEAPTLNMPAIPRGLQSAPQSRVNLGRPTTPSWADFLSTGFVDEKHQSPAVLLPPDKVLPPLNMRTHSSQSQRRMTDDSSSLEPGELANITNFILDDAFWWTWITSLAGEEPPTRKAVFGRCALIETRIYGGSWLVMEEIVKGAAPEPEVGTYVAEKKSRFTFGKKLSRSKSSAKGANLPRAAALANSASARQGPPQAAGKTIIAPDQQARIQAAAAALQEKKRQEEAATSRRRGRIGESSHQKTQSVLTLQPTIVKEAAPAMRWANSYDKNTIRTKYLGNEFAGRGSAVDLKEVLEAGDAVDRRAQSPMSGDTPKDASRPEEKSPMRAAEDTDVALPPRDSSLQRRPEPRAVASPSTQPATPPTDPSSNGKKGETSPQAASFFATHLPLTPQQAQGSKPLPAQPESVSPESRPPPPPKQGKPAQAGPRSPAFAPQAPPMQPDEEQRAIPPQQRTPQRAEVIAPPAAPKDARPEEPKRAPPKPQDQKMDPVPTERGPQMEEAARKTTEVSVTSEPADKENRAPLQQARSKESTDQQRAPPTPVSSSQGISDPPSPEAGKADRNKLRKKNRTVGKGLKTIFTMKRAEEEPRPVAKPARSALNVSPSVAAARAALEAKAKQSQPSSASSTNRVTTKRYSTAGKNGALEEVVAPSRPVAREEPHSSPRPEPRAAPPPQPREPEVVAASADRPASTAASSQIDPAEEKRAQEAFGSFDQGGMEPNSPNQPDIPSNENLAPPTSGETPFVTPLIEKSDPNKPPSVESSVSPLSERADDPVEVPPTEAAREVPIEPKEVVVDPGDRWAQIRKNAAERAARMSEEQSGGRTDQASRTEDDGETSGEETIESRVARIKARVAELTGNMDTGAHKA